MINLNYTEILRKHSELVSKQSDSTYEIGLLSNITLNQLKEPLELQLMMDGIHGRVRVGDYDNIVQDSQGFCNCHCVIIFMEIANLFEGAQYKINLLDASELDELASSIKGTIDLVFKNLNKTPLVLFNKFSTSFNYFYKLEKDNLDYLSDELNTYLENNAPLNVKPIPISNIISRIGSAGCIDMRFFYTSKVLYTIDFYKIYVNHIKHLILSSLGKVKKIVVVDCDNTLWKGVLGEDGFNGITMTPGNPVGEIFQEIQGVLLHWAKNGVLIGLCSKNNPDDVEKVLHQHKDMLLRDKFITIKKVNWNDKVSNLKEIAQELSIGLDSFVFVDDSDFEINLVRRHLPEVMVIQVPKKLHLYPQQLREKGRVFSCSSHTSEDAKRIEYYKDQAQRKKFKNTYDDLNEYLISLEMKLKLSVDDIENVQRLTQLTQKTNQFNLTTKRYTDSDIANFISDPSTMVMSADLSDKFGNSGITALCVVIKMNKAADVWYIDTFLMSCRILGRGVEFVIIDELISLLKSKGVKKVYSMYDVSSKNKQVENFYEKSGFKLIENCISSKKYLLDISSYKISKKQHKIEVIRNVEYVQ